MFADGTFSYSHDGSETVTDEVTYSISDGSVTAETTVMINISPVNDAPVAAIISNTATTVSDVFTLALPENLFTDPDTDDSLDISATLADSSPLPEWLTFDDSSLTFSGTPIEAETLNIVLIATDSQGQLAQTAFTVTVEPELATAKEQPLTALWRLPTFQVRQPFFVTSIFLAAQSKPIGNSM